MMFFILKNINEKDIINSGRQKDIDSGKEENYGDKKSYNRT